ncbi:cytosine-specific methyltransferase [Fulvitalea axinellae]|uniref:Cytosine-specific methyltransferase n=1 Tax=Fulvitalea axinellae TaxID=1182444 RepID=A0AAU9D9A2_9BACT|nr:cytosine-specific methyltransferase [Fulvitalea axinellae]
MRRIPLNYSEARTKLGFRLRNAEDLNALASLTHYWQTKHSVYRRGARLGWNHLVAKRKAFAMGPFSPDWFPGSYDVPIPPVDSPKFRFIDLFAGIGGFRIAGQSFGGHCVFSSEIDRFARESYEHNYGEVPFGDICNIDSENIPDHDLLCAGFPCQAFSIAGRRGGFDDTRGTLFFEIARIIKAKRPKVVLLENVKGLTNHQKGRTLDTIIRTLKKNLRYIVPGPRILNARNFGVPQNRERIFIVAFREDVDAEAFQYPKAQDDSKTFLDIREEEAVASKYFVSERYWKSLKAHKARHAAKGNGFGYEIIPDDGQSNAIMVGGMGRERNLVIDQRPTMNEILNLRKPSGPINGESVRRMTPREWARLQGFPDSFQIAVSDGQAYKQFGNSVAIPVVKAMLEQIVPSLLSVKTSEELTQV